MINDETKKKLDTMGMHALVEALEVQEKMLESFCIVFTKKI